jgi:hypothetical protein
MDTLKLGTKNSKIVVFLKEYGFFYWQSKDSYSILFKVFAISSLQAIQISLKYITSKKYSIASGYHDHDHNAVRDRWISNCSAISWREQVICQWEDDEVRIVLDQHA